MNVGGIMIDFLSCTYIRYFACKICNDRMSKQKQQTISPLSPNVTEIKRYTRRFNKIKIAGKLVLYFGYNIYETGKQHPIAAHNLHVYLCNSFN